MANEVTTTANDSVLPPLSPKQAMTLMAMITSVTDAEAIAKSPYSMAQYYRLKPILQKYKEAYLNKSVEQSLEMLKALSPKAVAELGNEVDNRDVRVRNKAANDILDKALPKAQTAPNVQVNVQNVIEKQKEGYKLDE